MIVGGVIVGGVEISALQIALSALAFLLVIAYAAWAIRSMGR